MKQNDVLMIVAVVAVILALFNLVVLINKVNNFKSFTGFATDTGTANLTIEGAASVNFTTDNINWGTGHVIEPAASATLNTEGVNTSGTWNATSQGLVLENIGNTNVTLNLTSSKNASVFIGGASPSFEWKVNDTSGETGSCVSGSSIPGYTTVTTAPQIACTNFGWNNTRDSLDIDLQLVIPSSAASGEKGVTIIATATAI
jgi:hypothetical protein